MFGLAKVQQLGHPSLWVQAHRTKSPLATLQRALSSVALPKWISAAATSKFFLSVPQIEACLLSELHCTYPDRSARKRRWTNMK